MRPELEVPGKDAHYGGAVPNVTLPHSAVRRTSMNKPASTPPFSVAMTACASYERPAVEAAVRHTLAASSWQVPRGGLVLVKPNLLCAKPLACTHPEVVRAACLWLLEQNVSVVVADSPGFGTARGVANAVGLSDALKPLGLAVRECGEAVPVRLPDGRSWGVSRTALECDALLSIPKVKTHSQMRLSLAVKNLFGCVCGLRKAVAHTVQGNQPDLFEDCVAALWEALPPTGGLADGITAMHVTGPSKGSPFALGCVAASASAAALDTALYATLGAEPQAIPVWSALVRRGVAEASPAALAYPLSRPHDFPAKGFVLPDMLLDVSFRPHRLAVSLCRRIWRSFRP